MPTRIINYFIDLVVNAVNVHLAAFIDFNYGIRKVFRLKSSTFFPLRIKWASLSRWMSVCVPIFNERKRESLSDMFFSTLILISGTVGHNDILQDIK